MSANCDSNYENGGRVDGRKPTTKRCVGRANPAALTAWMILASVVFAVMAVTELAVPVSIVPAKSKSPAPCRPDFAGYRRLIDGAVSSDDATIERNRAPGFTLPVHPVSPGWREPDLRHQPAESRHHPALVRAVPDSVPRAI